MAIWQGFDADKELARITAVIRPYEERIAALTAELEAARRDAVYKDLAFDGHAVFSALTDYARRRTGPENVSDVLDALVLAAKRRAAARQQEAKNGR